MKSLERVNSLERIKSLERSRADFIVTAGEVDGVGPARGEITLRSYFEELLARES